MNNNMKRDSAKESLSHEQPKKTDDNHNKTAEKEKELNELKNEIERLKSELEKARENEKNLDDSYRRKVAEFDNYRKRVMKQMEDMVHEATKKFVKEILPIFDNFGRAIKNSEVNKDFNQLFEGLKITYSQISNFLEHLGIKTIETTGKEFDPNIHEALLMEEKDDIPYDKTVTEELEKGYILGNSVIRPSKVKVAKKKNKNEGDKYAE